MTRRSQYFVLIGIGLMTLVVLIMLVSPDFIFTPAITVIGGDPNKSTTDQVSVTTRTDFSSTEQLAKFPLEFGKWHGRDYPSAPYLEILKATSVLIRGYNPDTFTQPVFLIVVQGTSDSSIHEPHYCFPNIEEQAKEELLITNTAWTKGGSSVSVPLNKLVSIPTDKNGNLLERRIVLYFYVKGNQFYSDQVTLVEVQALAPLKGPYDSTLQEEKLFLSEVVPLMFQPGSNAEWKPVIKSLAGQGTGGGVVIALAFLIPVGVMFYPVIRRRRAAK